MNYTTLPIQQLRITSSHSEVCIHLQLQICISLMTFRRFCAFQKDYEVEACTSAQAFEGIFHEDF